jgi:hypothetical protein
LQDRSESEENNVVPVRRGSQKNTFLNFASLLFLEFFFLQLVLLLAGQVQLNISQNDAITPSFSSAEYLARAEVLLHLVSNNRLLSRGEGGVLGGNRIRACLTAGRRAAPELRRALTELRRTLSKLPPVP